jgi:hypothetical protein
MIPLRLKNNLRDDLIFKKLFTKQVPKPDGQSETFVEKP